MPKHKFFYCMEADGADGGGVPAGEPSGVPPVHPAGDGGGNPTPPPAGEAKPGQMPNPFAPKPAAEGPKPPAEAVVPEEYKFNLPEGMTISDDLKGKFTEIAKGAKLTQEQADALIKMHADTVMDLNGRAAAMANSWLDESHKQGLDTEENLGLVNETLNMFGTDELRNILVESGVACHPEVLSFLQRIGSLIHEDKPTSGGNAASSGQVNFFPNSKY